MGRALPAGSRRACSPAPPPRVESFFLEPVDSAPAVGWRPSRSSRGRWCASSGWRVGAAPRWSLARSPPSWRVRDPGGAAAVCSARLGRAAFRSPRMPRHGSRVSWRTCREPRRARSAGCASSGARTRCGCPRRPPSRPARHRRRLGRARRRARLGRRPCGDRRDPGRRAALARVAAECIARVGPAPVVVLNRAPHDQPGAVRLPNSPLGARLALGGREARGELGRAIAELADLLRGGAVRPRDRRPRSRPRAVRRR